MNCEFGWTFPGSPATIALLPPPEVIWSRFDVPVAPKERASRCNPTSNFLVRTTPFIPQAHHQHQSYPSHTLLHSLLLFRLAVNRRSRFHALSLQPPRRTLWTWKLRTRFSDPRPTGQITSGGVQLARKPSLGITEAPSWKAKPDQVIGRAESQSVVKALGHIVPDGLNASATHAGLLRNYVLKRHRHSTVRICYHYQTVPIPFAISSQCRLGV